MKNYYMACLDLSGRRAVVVGDGGTADEKVAGLEACGAAVVRVSPKRYRRRLLRGAYVVIAATDDRGLNERIFRDAEKRALLCNVADVPELCTFILPAVHREGPIAVAVSTGGASPALAKRLREEIAQIVRPEHADLAEELRALRPEVKARFQTYDERRDYFDRLVRERLS
ncbi:MAG TPA: bifunctional precorrin-2 dehydrogenase/sirohydrochlorin ferrochelatase [Gaiellaceae bacterium]|nr:bifunctional precorrin-2 dehydrogenase/sirohydrochlorin ferrochelatase [Gaiellaceae bacterium]